MLVLDGPCFELLSWCKLFTDKWQTSDVVEDWCLTPLESNICVRFQHSTRTYCKLRQYVTVSFTSLAFTLSGTHQGAQWEDKTFGSFLASIAQCSNETLVLVMWGNAICHLRRAFDFVPRPTPTWWLWNVSDSTLFPISQELTQANATKAQVQGLVFESHRLGHCMNLQNIYFELFQLILQHF